LRVFENRVLRKIFSPKGNEIMGVWRKLLNEELHSLKSKRMKWAEYVARIGDRINTYSFWWESQKERDHQKKL
jgi:hypothetical protein